MKSGSLTSQHLRIKVDDEFSGIKKYRASINGKWILMEHEPKRKLLFFEFDDIKFSKTELKLNLHCRRHGRKCK